MSGEWTWPGWIAEATAWIDERLSAAGLQRTGPVEQPRVRPWATVLMPLGVDAGRGWVLLPDGGPPLGELLDGEALRAALCDAMAQYAQLQRALVPHAGVRGRSSCSTALQRCGRGSGTGRTASRPCRRHRAWTTTTCTRGTSCAEARRAATGSTTGATADGLYLERF
jgi:hypothetical protein